MSDDNDNDTNTYVLQRGTHDGKEPGDEVELTEEKRATFDPQGEKFVPAEETDVSGQDVESGGEPETADPVQETSVDAPFDPSDYTVDEFEGKLENEGYDAAELHALRDAETDGDDREGVKDALDDQLNEE